MLRNVTFSQVDSTDEIAKEMNIIIDEVNHIGATVARIEANTDKTGAKIDAINAEIKAEAEAAKTPPRKPRKAPRKPVSGRKPSKRRKGSVLTKTLVSLVVLVLWFSGVCFSQDQWPITYDTVSTPNQLVQLLRNRFSNQSGNYFTFGPTTTAPAHSAGRVYYHTVSGLYVSDGTAWDAIDTAGGLSLDGAYDLGYAVTVDGTAITLTVTDSANNRGLIINQNDVTTGTNPDALQILLASGHTGVAIDIDGRSTASDIEGTGALWSVSGSGVGTFAGLIVGATDITFTNSETIDNDDNGEITFSDGTDDTAISWSGSTLQWTTDTAIDTVSWGDLDAHTGLTDITGDATDFTISHTGSGAGADLLITQSGAGDNALTLTSGGTATDAIGLISAAGITMTSMVEASAWTQTATGTDDDLTISVAGAYDASLILSSGGTGLDAISIFTTHSGGDIKILSTDTIDIDATDHVTIDISGAAADFDVDSAAGSISLDGGETASDAIVIIASATAGGIDIDSGTAGIAIDTTGGIDISSSEAADGAITIATSSSTGQIVITATDTTVDALDINSSGGIDIDTADDFTVNVAGASGEDVIITNTGGSISLVATEAAVADAIVIYASAADSGIDIDGGTAGINIKATGGDVKLENTTAKDIILDATAGRVVITGTESAASAVEIIADGTAGGVSIDAKTNGIILTAASGDITLSTSGNAGDVITLTNTTGTGTSAIELTSTAGTVDINAKEIITIDLTGGTVGTSDIRITNAQGTDEGAIELTATAGGIDLNAAAGKDITLTGGQIDIDSAHDTTSAISLTTNVGTSETIVITNTQGNTTDAITITATAGGINMAAADDISIVLASTGTTEDLIISLTGAQTSSILIDSEGSDTDALSLTTSTNAGDIVISSNDKIDMDSVGTFALNVAADTLLIQVDSDGTGNDDLTLNVDGDDDAHILLSSDGTSINTISLLESGTGTGGGILIRADTGTGAADGVASVQLLSDVGGIGIKAGVDDTDAIDIDASVGSVDIDGAKNVTINAGTDLTIQVDSTTTGDDLLIRVDGDDDSHITLDSDGTSIDTIYIHQSGSNTAAGIKIHADTGIAYADGVASIQLLSDDGGVAISAGVAQANAINIDAGAGGVDVDAALQINIASSQAAATAIVINASNAAGGIDIDAQEDINIKLTASTTGEDIIIETGGDQDSQITIIADGSAENAFSVLCDAGNIDLQGDGASGEDFDIVSTNSALNLSSGEATDDAISIQASAGGIDMDGAKSIWITTSENAVDAIYIHASAGGIDITAASGGGSEDIDIITTGGADSHIKIIADGTSADALKLQASAGGIDIDGGGAHDITIDTSKSILLTSTEAVSDSIGLTATGNITLTTTDAAGILVNTATYEHKAKYYAISAGVTTASEIIVVGGTGLTCVGLSAGVAEIGSTEGYAELSDLTDYIRYAITLPDDFVDTGLQADLIITWDIHEQHAGGGDTNTDIDVLIYEYDGATANTTAIVTDTIDVADTAARALNGLVTLSAGIGNDVELQAGDVLIFELTGTADTDDFNLYGMKLSYRVGIQATE